MSHKKFGPDRFSRFDVYWILTNKQTNKQTDRQTNKQTDRQAKFIYRSVIFQNIWKGDGNSDRYNIYQLGGGNRQQLMHNMIRDPYTDPQIDWTLNEISKVSKPTRKKTS